MGPTSVLLISLFLVAPSFLSVIGMKCRTDEDSNDGDSTFQEILQTCRNEERNNQQDQYGGRNGEQDQYGERNGHQDQYGGRNGEQDQYGGRNNQQDQYGGRNNQQDQYGGRNNQQDQYGGRNNQQDQYGGRNNQQDQYGGRNNQQDQYGERNNQQDQYGGRNNQQDQYGERNNQQDQYGGRNGQQDPSDDSSDEAYRGQLAARNRYEGQQQSGAGNHGNGRNSQQDTRNHKDRFTFNQDSGEQRKDRGDDRSNQNPESRFAARNRTGLQQDRDRDRDRDRESSSEGDDLEQLDACTVHCVFRHMQMLDRRGVPDKMATVHVLTRGLRDRHVRHFVADAVDTCHGLARADAGQDACRFAKNLALCFQEKGRRTCDDWDEPSPSPAISKYPYYKQY